MKKSGSYLSRTTKWILGGSQALVFSLACMPSQAQNTLPTVYMSGTRAYTEDFWNWSWALGIQETPVWYGPPMPAQFHIDRQNFTALAKALRDTGDVRCSWDKATRKVTSHASQDDRQMAAVTVYSQMRLLNVGRPAVISAGVLTVTYADGGTEKWPVPNPTFSEGGITLPVPGSLNQGDGTVQPSSIAPCKALS